MQAKQQKFFQRKTGIFEKSYILILLILTLISAFSFLGVVTVAPFIPLLATFAVVAAGLILGKKGILNFQALWNSFLTLKDGFSSFFTKTITTKNKSSSENLKESSVEDMEADKILKDIFELPDFLGAIKLEDFLKELQSFRTTSFYTNKYVDKIQLF